MQQTLLKAWEQIESYRGDSAFSSWLCAIDSHLAIDFLRRQKRWRVRAQVAYANECLQNGNLAAEIIQPYASPGFAYDVHEHIAYCFACVGRSLDPDEYAAVVLRELLDLSNREAATALEVSESELRHRLAAGRRVMADEFEGLCSLVNQNGVCYQCIVLRDIAPQAKQGPEPSKDLSSDERLRLGLCVHGGVIAVQPPDVQQPRWLSPIFLDIGSCSRAVTQASDRAPGLVLRPAAS